MKKHAVRFTVDFINQKIIGTKASFDKASKGFGPIYEELADKVDKHPDFKLLVKEQKKHTTKAKKTYNGMDFAFMKAYISTRKNAEQIMKVAYELGQSRVIVGFHYQSDVDAGRVVGSITFARLCADETFQKMLDKARREFAKNSRGK